MSSLSASQGGDGASAKAALAPARDWLSPATILMTVLLALPFVGLFVEWFHRQFQFSWGSEDWSHAFIVPLISGYAVWKNRERIQRARALIFWPGMVPLLVGIVCYFFFLLGYPNHMFSGFAMVLTLFGLALLLLGPRMMTFLMFPIAYLGFAVTISEMVMNKITFELQRIATWGSWALLNTLSISTERAGNTLFILTDAGKEIPLNVAEACSGMRMLVAFYALGVAVAFLSCKQWWQRIALLLLAGPIALLVNVLRVAFLGVASLWDPEMAKGDMHMFIGVLWLVPAFALFMGAVWALQQIVKDSEQSAGEPEPVSTDAGEAAS